MNVAYCTEYQSWLQNQMFDVNAECNTNNVLERYISLRNYLKERDINLNTFDMYKDVKEVDIWLVQEPTPGTVSFISRNNIEPAKVIFFLHEPYVVNPWGWDYINKNRGLYKAILTWEGQTTKTDKRFFHYHFPVTFDSSNYQSYKKREKKNLCLIMHSNKLSGIEGEMYSFRRKIMEYFQNRGDRLLDVYGYGWNDNNHPSPFHTDLYKGTTANKLDTYSEYHFSFCIDNCVVPGYITYDPLVSMSVGTVPIYIPMPDSKEFIPENTFIDLLNFKSFDELVRHLKSLIKTKEYERYRERGWKFINSEKYYPFTIPKFCEDIYRAIDYVRSELGADGHAWIEGDRGEFISPQEAGKYLNPHFAKLLPMDAGIIKRVADPINLLNPKRFDVMAKYLYVKYRDMAIESDWALKLYDEHVRVFNGYEERDGSGKKGSAAFIGSFNKTIDSIKKNGFDPAKSMIPATNNNDLIEGSHRLAASLYFQAPVHVLSFASGLWDYNWSFFKQKGLSEEYMDIIAYEYCKLKKNTRIVLLFPSAVGEENRVRNILLKYASIYYEKEIRLRNNGPTLLMTQVYRGENWVGDIKSGFPGARQKAEACFRSNEPLRVFIVEAEDMEGLKSAKEEIRAIYGISNHSVHINDTYEETIRVGQVLLNGNSIHFMNHGSIGFFERFQRTYAIYRGLLEKAEVDRELFCVGGSAVMALYGLRDARDIDYLHYGDELHGADSGEIGSHNGEIKYYPTSKDDILFNPADHFYFDGIKFASLEIVRKFKERRGEEKDRKDVRRIEMLTGIFSHLEQNEGIGTPVSVPEGPELVSIIILNHNRLNDLKICLESIHRNTPEDHEIIIVENASEDGSRDYLRSLPNITLIENPTNIGCPPARAQALCLARGNYVILLDNDTVVTKGWTTKFIKYAKTSPRIGIIGPRSNYVSGEQVVPDVPYRDINGLMQFAEEWERTHEGQLAVSNKLIGFCMFIRREVIDKIGNIDGSFGPFGFEDDDYTWRAFIGGFLTVVAHDVFIHHTGGPQGQGSSQYNKALLDAWEVFKGKWGLSTDLPYGSGYDVSDIVLQPFDKQKHYLKLPDRSEIESLIYRRGSEDSMTGKEPALLSRNRQAAILREQGKYEPAIKQLELALKEGGEDAEVENDIGVLYYQNGDKQRALHYFEKSVQVDPDSLDYRKNLADLLLEMGHADEAIDHYEKVLEMDPEDIDTLIMVGTICFQSKQVDDALIIFRKVLALDPENTTAAEYVQELAGGGNGSGQPLYTATNPAVDGKKIVSIKKRALITGLTGQDGSYLAEFLLSKGYEVHGLIRRASTFNTGRIDHIFIDEHVPGARLFVHYGDLSDSGQLINLIYNVQPDEIYSLGAQSHVRVSFEMPEYTGDITGLGTTRLLEAIRRSGIKTKFYQASSSEMFGASDPPQNENTPFYPRSPYAAAKIYAFWMTVNYREGYGLFASNGILFNHESPRRGETFLTRKITRAIANMLSGKQKKLYLGNLNAKRDWGFAPEYVEVMWNLLQQDGPDDFVVGTGESHSVREFVERAFEYAGLEIEWEDEGIREKAVVKSMAKRWNDMFKPGEPIVVIDPQYFRPTEVRFLQADIAKARAKLEWEPRTTFDELLKVMVDYDMKLVGFEPVGDGITISKSNGYAYTNHDFSFYEKIREG